MYTYEFERRGDGKWPSSRKFDRSFGATRAAYIISVLRVPPSPPRRCRCHYARPPWTPRIVLLIYAKVGLASSLPSPLASPLSPVPPVLSISISLVRCTGELWSPCY